MERVTADRGAEHLFRGVEMADLAKRRAEIVAGRAMVRLCRHRLAELLGRRNPATGIAQHRAIIVQEVRILRLGPQRLFNQRKSLGTATGLMQKQAEKMRGRGMVCLGAKHLPVEVFGFLQPPHLVQLQRLPDGAIQIATARWLRRATGPTLCAFAPSQCPVDGTPAMFV